MTTDVTLRRFAWDIGRAPTEHAIAAAVMDQGRAIARTRAIGYYAMRSLTEPLEIHTRGLDGVEAMLELYEEFGREVDPVFRWVVRNHALRQVSYEAIAREPGVGELIRRAKTLGLFRHYMLAPIVVDGAIAALLYFASDRSAPFDEGVGMAMSLHVSTRLAVLRSLDTLAAKWDGALERREGEIAELAMRGLSVPEMAREAGISANTVKKYMKTLYAKLGVGSRLDLASQLLRGPKVRDATVLLPEPTRIGGASAYRYPV